MNRDIGRDDIDESLLRPRRLKILQVLMEMGTLKISDLRKLLNIPTSSLYYDIEILRVNGMVVRDGPYVRITNKGRSIMEKLKSTASTNEELGETRIERVANIVLLRPLVMNLLRLGPGTLLIYSILLITFGLAVSLITGYKLILLLYVQGEPALTQGISAISLLTYIGVALLIYRYALGGIIVDLRLVSGVLASLIPLMLYPSIMAIISPVLPPLPLSIIDPVLRVLLMLSSLFILATVLSVLTGKPVEYPLLYETLLLLIPTLIIYLLLF
ncbi:MarR family winged helix-turn-helix transcriptional regulator [Vulcanisaeta thermophila]|uniref:MarR family winged helix-turn-helix transcriptional regulator n=1 Tax=Vulcanisaeta thermophila TaxID=867917 RepID=UPI000853275B|nr:MarR family winged helix-turn-helix transcriptional regulator [Vulcanisaeta thermophila]